MVDRGCTYFVSVEDLKLTSGQMIVETTAGRIMIPPIPMQPINKTANA